MKYLADITSNQDLEKIYEKYSDIFHLSDIFAWFFRFLGGLILKGVYIMVSGIETIYDKAFAVMGFVNSNSLNPYIKAFRYIGWGLLGILLAWIGIKYIHNTQVKLSQSLKSVLVGLVTVVVLPSTITWSMDLVQSSKTYIENVGNSKDVNNLSFIPIKSNIIDLKQMDASNFKVDPANLKNKNTFDSNYFVNVWSYTTTIQDDDAAKMNNPTVFQKKLIEDTSGGKNAVAVDDLSSHIFASFLNEYYYRYSGHIFLIILELLILGFFFIVMTLKIMSLVYELGFTKVIAPAIAFTDDSGARIKLLINSVVGVMASLELSIMTVPYYSLGMTWLSQSLGSLKLNLVQTAIYFILGEISFFFVLFKGFDLVAKITGVRQGYGSELLQAAIGFGAVGAAANKLGQGAMGAGKALYNKTNPPEQNGGAGQYANPNVPEDEPNNSNLKPNNEVDSSIADEFKGSGSGSSYSPFETSSASSSNNPTSSANSTNADNGNTTMPNSPDINSATSSTSLSSNSSAGSATGGNSPENNPNLSQSTASTTMNEDSNNSGSSTNSTGSQGSQDDKPLNNNDNPNVNPQNNDGGGSIGSTSSNNGNNGSSETREAPTVDNGNNNLNNPNVDNGGNTDNNIDNVNVGSSAPTPSSTVNTTNPNVSPTPSSTSQSFNNGGDNITVENANVPDNNTSVNTETPNVSNVTETTNPNTTTISNNPEIADSLKKNQESRSALDKINKMYYGASVINRATEENMHGDFKD